MATSDTTSPLTDTTTTIPIINDHNGSSVSSPQETSKKTLKFQTEKIYGHVLFTKTLKTVHVSAFWSFTEIVSIILSMNSHSSVVICQDPRPMNRISMEDPRRFHLGDPVMCPSIRAILTYLLSFNRYSYFSNAKQRFNRRCCPSVLLSYV